jgi:hypothetical protein
VARRTALLAAGAAAAAFGIYLYRQGTLPSLTADQRAWGDISYSPYVHFLHQSPGAYIRHFPQMVGQNCLPQVIQNESLGRAVPMVEVDRASYPQ